MSSLGLCFRNEGEGAEVRLESVKKPRDENRGRVEYKELPRDSGTFIKSGLGC